MGNTAPATPIPDEGAPPSSDPQEAEEATFEWPENMYTETRDMIALAFLIYSFGYILEAARKYPDEFVGLEVKQEGVEPKTSTAATKPGQAHKSGLTDRALERSFMPSEIIKLIEDNSEILVRDFGTFEGSLASLRLLQERAEAASGSIQRPITLEEFDDKHQKHELVYGVSVDRINKRVTLAFRGTDNELAFSSNWSTNASVSKRTVQLPPFFKGKAKTDTIKFHVGFYSYLFEKTFDDSDDPDRRKYDEIMDDVLQLLDKHEGFKLYVTGHSLGGALATVVSFFLAADSRIPKPVTCISAAAPRVGDSTYADAVQILERTRQLRYCRVVNENDYVAFMPVIGYQHAGFQVRLSKDSSTPPTIDYPKLNDSWAGKFGRTWGNSLMANTNFGYDHDDYQERVAEHQAALENMDLNELYSNFNITGWEYED